MMKNKEKTFKSEEMEESQRDGIVLTYKKEVQEMVKKMPKAKREALEMYLNSVDGKRETQQFNLKNINTKRYFTDNGKVIKMETRYKVDEQEVKRGNYAIKNMTASLVGIPSDENKKKIMYEFNQKGKD